MNSAKGGLQGLNKNKLDVSKGVTKRMTVVIAPGGLNSSLGGPKGLNFKKNVA